MKNILLTLLLLSPLAFAQEKSLFETLFEIEKPNLKTLNCAGTDISTIKAGGYEETDSVPHATFYYIGDKVIFSRYLGDLALLLTKSVDTWSPYFDYAKASVTDEEISYIADKPQKDLVATADLEELGLVPTKLYEKLVINRDTGSYYQQYIAHFQQGENLVERNSEIVGECTVVKEKKF